MRTGFFFRTFRCKLTVEGSINTRINVLYFVDSLLDASLQLSAKDAPYLGFLARDAEAMVWNVVPDTREGVLNLKSTKQVIFISSLLSKAHEEEKEVHA